MKIKSYKNQYNFEVVDCPFCGYFSYVREVTKASPDPLRDLKRHITNQAKNEAFLFHFNGPEGTPIPHLDYYKSHTTNERIILKSPKRYFDNDMELSHD